MSDDLSHFLADKAALSVGGVPDGYQPLVLADAVRALGDRLIFIARDAARMETLARALAFFAPEVPVLKFPAWDCLPYDRVSPQASAVAARMAALAALPRHEGRAHVLLTTISAAMQRTIPRTAATSFTADTGETIEIEKLLRFLDDNGYRRCTTVMEAGDFAVRGGIIDLFAPGADAPVRLDMFGDRIESVRIFDPESQRQTGTQDGIALTAASEIPLDAKAVKRFRRGYVAQFGAVVGQDPLYEAVSNAMPHRGMEHWLPLFHDTPETLFDHCGAHLYVFDTLAEEACRERGAQIADYYTARREAYEKGEVVKPLPPDALYLMPKAWAACLAAHRIRYFSAFELPPTEDSYNLEAHAGQRFEAARAREDADLFEEVAAHIAALQGQGKRVVLAGRSAGSCARLTDLIGAVRDGEIVPADDWPSVLAQDAPAIIALPMENGFETEHLAFITEQDILGDRMARPRRRKRADNFLTEAASLKPGDHVVHVEHGIGRFEGLQAIDVSGAVHDCLKLIYRDDTRLFLPVENIELLSRYGGDDMAVMLDRIGGHAWGARKRRLQEKLKEIADDLIRLAADRAVRQGEVLTPEGELYDAFCVRFPFEETDDQRDAIDAVLEDMAQGRPMDRLVCGDVGFGKTEVALRAAFVAAQGGKQAALIAPTTLLARQHAESFRTRFAGLPVNIGELSRLVGASEAKATRAGLADGSIDIVVGTHALLAESVNFDRLGLVIVDEEQHFGVTHKERLKTLRAQVHVLTLTATPIPRTLQMALTGVRDLSVIATPPVDRLAVRTYVTPFDGVILREALLREKYRSGQSFFVVPRVADIEEIAAFLREHLPELRFVVAHGQMSSGDLEARMSEFYGGGYDILLSTSIIESGLDIPTANTIIIHRADMFGLAQLYQLRGRVGRAKTRAYAYLLYNENKELGERAEKRLEVMQRLDSLGAGFELASYDLDLRGAGNLLGAEQSGHIREVGFELYQSMLESAIADRQGQVVEESWSPRINIGVSVLIPESYVPDFDLRMGLYRRLARLVDAAEIDAFAAELIDRFGALPLEVTHLLEVLSIKHACLKAGIEKVEAGGRGVALTFRNQSFAAPDALIDFITKAGAGAKLRPDHSLVLHVEEADTIRRLRAVRRIITQLAELAA